jgi:hypothetical protein
VSATNPQPTRRCFTKLSSIRSSWWTNPIFVTGWLYLSAMNPRPPSRAAYFLKGCPKKGKKWPLSKCDWRIWLTGKYDCHIWLGVHQTRSMSLPMKAHVVPKRRIRYIRRILHWYMTASHIFEFHAPKRLRPDKMWLHVVTSHPQSYFPSHKIPNLL